MKIKFYVTAVVSVGVANSLTETNFYQFKRMSYTRYFSPIMVKRSFYVIASAYIYVILRDV